MAIDRITRFRQASEFTGFHKKLGILVAPYLNQRWTMADIGCGLGLIDFEIAGYVKSIQAIDIDEFALNDLSRHIRDELYLGRSIADKIDVRRDNAFELSGEKWDIVLSCFFGATSEDLERFKSFARHRMIIITRGQERKGMFDPIPSSYSKVYSTERVEKWLKEQGLGYRKSLVDLQFGQPFKTIADIHDFLDAYHLRHPELARPQLIIPDDDDEEEREHLVEGGFDVETLIYSAEDRIIRTKRFDFPYYLPRNLRVAIFIIVCR